MATPKDVIEKQWLAWQADNPIESFLHIDTEVLKTRLIEDLSYASTMDVKTYTLYQKWCEIQERYPTFQASTLFGQETQMVSFEQEKLIKDVQKTFWMPQSNEDYLTLKPKLIISNGELAETWNAIRTFSSTMKNNSNIGRNLFYTVIDEISDKILGVICISSDFLDLTPRDSAIGWSRDVKTQQGMINYTAIGSTIVPLQPLGYNYSGGKLLALLCLSDTVQRDWKERYGDVLVGVTTTSLYGKTKIGGLSQYDGLEHWNKMGFTTGSVPFEPTKATKKMAMMWFKENYTRQYFELWEAKNLAGLPHKRDHKNRSLQIVYSKLKIPKNLIRTEHQRGIYFSPLYNNSFEFLRKEINENQLVKSFDTTESTLTEIWKTKHAKSRIKILTKKNQVSSETLFYDDLIYLTWDETKEKYLSQIGR